jgi:amino acid adenylation domain-containing protein
LQEHRSNPNTQPNLANVSEAKRNLLLKCLRGEFDSDLSSSRAIARQTPDAPQHLSFAQERLWFLDQLMPGSAVFNVPIAVRLSGSTDLSALQKSINEIVRRHEVFRTTFITVEGQPSPVISSALDLELQVIDLGSLTAAERDAEARRLTKEEALQPFDLARGPLIRTGLIKIGEQESIFLLTMHHIVSDGWSIVLFFKELSVFYQAFSNDKASPLSELPVQYTDYAAWQREWLRGEVLAQQVSYWKNQLAGELPVVELPADHPRPAVQTYQGARAILTLSTELTQAVVAFSRREGATLFMTLLAGFKVLLHHYTGQEDIIVGSPIANRPQAETEKLIGFFLNNLALRTDLSGDPNFRELLSRVRQTALDAFANQDVPFEKLIEELKPDRDMSRTAIFQVYFNLFNFSDEIELPDGKTISFVDAWLQSEENLSKFDLTLYAGLQSSELKLAFVYNTDLFEEASITRMLAHFRNLLASVVGNPECAISNYSLGDEPVITSDRVRPTNDFLSFDRAEIEQPINRRFEAQVRKYPARTAVKTKNHAWTYEELNAKANQIAHSIVGPCGNGDERVALLFEHDAPMIAAMLGALKAGKTYVPLDPNYPEERLSYILEHSESTALLTDEKNLDLARRLKGPAGLINIDGLPSSASTSDLNLPIDPNGLAYILYTSGSTGQPKGVMQNHRNVLHFIRVYTNNLHISSDDRLTLLSSYCFDASVMDIYGALLNGATLNPIDIRTDGLANLPEQLSVEEITIYHSTPTVYRYFVETLNERSEFPRLRLVVLGGEEVTRRDVELYRKHFSDGCLFVNGLGPTESTVSLQNFVDKQTMISGESVPVGFPVDDTEVLLLNQAGKPAAIQGEIAIKSPHVALGYWRNPEAARAAFLSVRSPTVREGSCSDRIYKTGDMGRRLPDGSIRFEGRKDFQIKIRGFRVELGEVESVLTQHPSVRESVVVAGLSDGRDKQLVAYVVPQSNQPNETDLRNFLKEKLPEYMLPAAFVMLDSLPLTASGKVNRRALPAPVKIKRELTLMAVPQTDLEGLLLPIWADVLGTQIGVHDNFFDCGGHSLMAVRLFAQIEKRLGHRLPLATLFQAPTVAQLAAVLEQDSRHEWTSLVPIQTSGDNPPFFCVHGLGGNVIEFYDLARRLGTAQPFYGLQSQGLDGKQPLHKSIKDMARHYISEMREVQPAGPYFIGGRSLGGTIAFEMACQLKAQGEEVGLLALLDAYPFGYEKVLPAVAMPETSFGRTANRIETHFRNLRRLAGAEKLSYLIAKMRYAPRKMKSFVWRRIYRVFRNFNRVLPRLLCDVAEFNSLAAREYVPQIYDGEVTLFWASDDLRAYDVVEGWHVLAVGGTEVIEVPGTHLNIIKEPHVAELAEKLNDSLARAQGRHLRILRPDNRTGLSKPRALAASPSARIKKAS